MIEGFNLWGLVALGFLLGFNAFFVAAEYALVSVRRTRMDELIASGLSEARYVRTAIDQLDRYIAATQVCITMAGIALGWVGEPALSAVIIAVLGLPLSVLEENVRRSLAAAIALLTVTFVTVVIGELVPKSVALKYTEQVALAVGRTVVLAGQVLRPFVWALNTAANLILRLLGVPSVTETGGAYSVQELKMMVEASEKIGVIENIEREMLHNVFDFGDSTAHELMVPRTEMVAVPADAALDDLVALVSQHPYTKYPVYEANHDQILGVLHVKDVVQAQRNERRSATVRGLMREALFVPETIKLDGLLREFQTKRQHLAIVLDEYGGTAGLVTLADLITEILGPVRDTFDKSMPDVQRLPDGTALIEGMTLIDTVNEQFELKLQDENYDTIAGFMLGRLDRIAQVGDVVETDHVRLKVEAMDGLRIERVSLRLISPPVEAPAPPT